MHPAVFRLSDRICRERRVDGSVLEIGAALRGLERSFPQRHDADVDLLRQMFLCEIRPSYKMHPRQRLDARNTFVRDHHQFNSQHPLQAHEHAHRRQQCLVHRH